MRNEYDLFDKNVGDTYMHLLQIRSDGVYRGDGIVVNNLPVGSGPEIISETLTISSQNEYLLELSQSPNNNYPVQVSWNGLWLRKGEDNDYTIYNNNIEINPEHQLDSGDVFIVTYYL